MLTVVQQKDTNQIKTLNIIDGLPACECDVLINDIKHIGNNGKGNPTILLTCHNCGKQYIEQWN